MGYNSKKAIFFFYQKTGKGIMNQSEPNTTAQAFEELSENTFRMVDVISTDRRKIDLP